MTRIRYINIINTVLVIIIFVSLIVIGNKPAKKEVSISKNSQLDTYLESVNLEKKEEKKIEIKVETKNQVETKKEEKKDTIVKAEPKAEIKTTVTEEKKEESKPVEQPSTQKETVIEKLVGGLAGYGPDCSGCSPYTATGMYIGNGNIYYQDKQYGKVRIVAGDKSFPFGTIVKMSNTNYYDNSPIYAIVLDRGGIGRGKKFLFDLLFNSEKEASNIGSRQNVTFEILRLGY